jgi:DNA gyrase/topoisomerase IV subunit B
MSILGLKLKKEYNNTKCLRYGRLMIMVNHVSDIKIIVY